SLTLKVMAVRALRSTAESFYSAIAGVAASSKSAMSIPRMMSSRVEAMQLDLLAMRTRFEGEAKLHRIRLGLQCRIVLGQPLHQCQVVRVVAQKSGPHFPRWAIPLSGRGTSPASAAPALANGRLPSPLRSAPALRWASIVSADATACVAKPRASDVANGQN